VVVVDSRPLFEGRRMLTTLLEAGITCEYCHLGALSYEITEVDKVGPSC
jgi:translation initiation factor eIF-2B subunit delta